MGLILVLATACASRSSATPAAANVEIYGALREIMHGGDRSSKVTLGARSSKSQGVGALADLAGEITLIDGEYTIARPYGDLVRLERRRQSDAGAALFVVVDVAAWHCIATDKDISPEGIDGAIEALAIANRMDGSRPIAVRIEGPVKDLGWHVVDGTKLDAAAGHEAHATSGPHGLIPDTTATLVGFYSRHHEGVLTHMGQRSHLHAVTAELSGHVDTVTIAAGTKICLGR